MGVDPTTHTLYLPTAELNPPAEGQTRPRPKPTPFRADESATKVLSLAANLVNYKLDACHRWICIYRRVRSRNWFDRTSSDEVLAKSRQAKNNFNCLEQNRHASLLISDPGG